MFFKPQRLHFTGIGGIGMSGIAEVLLNLGYTISGSDLKLSPITERLAAMGAEVHEGHDAANVAGAGALVVSSAVDEQNPEVQEARRLQIPVIPRGELLAELMRLKYGVAVAGSHGKTTTTSMAATILAFAGLDPTVVVGGRVGTMGGSNARVGRSDFLVVEADESDRSFLKLAPILAIVTNIDREHLDCYASLDDIRAAFIEFVNKVPFYGAAIVCLDDENVQGILPAVKRRTITYGTNAQADMQASEIGCGHFSSDFRLRFRGEDLGRFHLRIPGEHNVLNAMAAVVTALELDVQPDTIREALATFSGVDRRFQVRGKERGVTVIDDYGHHPTEIRATLAGARLCGFNRIHVLFQPHRYTRTFHLMDEFARAFHQADNLYVLDIYAASEKPIEGVTAEALVERIRQFGHRSVEYVGTIDRGVEALVAAARRRRPGADAGRRQRLAGRRRRAGAPAGGQRLIWRRARPANGIRWRLWLTAAGGLVLCVSTAFAAYKVRAYVLTDPQFIALRRRPRRAARPRAALRLPRRRCCASSRPISAAASSPSPLAERRRRLLAIDWVEDATVARIWPNRLVVRISERAPVAFVNLPLATGLTRVLLIDPHGVLLEPPPQSRFSFPVLGGITEAQTNRPAARACAP